MKLLAIVLSIGVVISLGCAGLGPTWDVLNTPINQIDTNPDLPGIQPAGDSTKTPLEEIVTNAPEVVGNPLDLESWGGLLKGIAILVLGAGGAVVAPKAYRKVTNGKATA